MTKEEREEAIVDIRDNIKPVVGGKSLDMAIQALEQEPKWIPVSERLPEKDDLYLICFDDGEYELSYFLNGEFCCNSAFSYSGVTAWMPLPQPYEPKGVNE